MTFTGQLKKEHETINVMLMVLEKICMQIESGEKINSEHLEKVLEFLRFFADKCHHQKEEDILFPAMEKAGMSDYHNTINAILSEHNKSREYIIKLEEAIENYKIKKRQNIEKMRTVNAELRKVQGEHNGMVQLISTFNIVAPEPGMVIYRKGWDGTPEV